MRFCVLKSVYEEISKSLESQKLDYFKKELIKILEKRGKTEIAKSVIAIHDEWLEKGGYGIGTIREWKGIKFKKIAPGKWRRIYESDGKGTKQSVSYVKKQIENAKDFEELGKIVSQNLQRFYVDRKLVPVAKEILDAAKGKQGKLKIDFSNALDEFVKNGMKGDKPFTVLKDTPAILQKYGFKDKTITINPSDVRKILSDDSKSVRNAHNLPLKVLKDLPTQLKNPLAIMNGNNEKKIILTEHIVNGNPVIAIIELDKNIGGKATVNSVRSLYDKEKNKIAEWLNDESVTLYIDEKRREQLASRGLQSTKGVNPAPHGGLDEKRVFSHFSNSNITPSSDSVKQKNDKFETVEDVVKAYKGTDNWLKAPNGKDTKLTEKQWCEVRTESFKKWFGDWENEPEKASKVIDENGEPMVVYHGSAANFDEFDKRKIGKRSDGVKGFYFSTEKRKASVSGYYAGEKGAIMPVFLNLRNPIIKEANEKVTDYSQYDGVISLFEEDSVDRYYDYKENKLGEVKLSKGDIVEILAFKPNQIKSAVNNNGKFDGNSNNINKSFREVVDFYLNRKGA